MAEIREKEFEEAMKNGISFKRCAFCNTPPIGEIDLPEYGAAIARIKCRGCRMFVGVFIEHETFTARKKLGTPKTAKTIGDAIKQAADAWNSINKS